MLEIKELIKHYEGLEPTTALLEKISLKEPAITELRGTSGSSQSVIASFAMLKNKGVHVFIRPDKESAAYFQNDLLALLDDESVYFFPSSYKRSVQFQQTEPSNIILRTAVLNQIAELEGNANNHQPTAIVTYPEALVEKVLSTENLKENTLKLIKNENISITFIEEVLQEYGFVHADFVYEPGQYSIRGSIVDIFSFSDARPYRIDFFGDEVESIRAFDVETQLSKKDFSSITIVPNLSDSKTTGIKKTFLEYLPKESTLWMDYPELIFDKVSSIYESTGFEQADKTSQLAGHDELKGQSNRFNVIITANNRYYKPAAKIEYDCLPQPAFNKNFDLLVEDIKQNKLLGYTTYILSDNEKQFDRLNTIFESLDADIHFEPVYKTLHQGFIDQSLRILVYTDHQIFDRYHKFKINRSFDKKATLTLKELTSLNPGDYVVHVDHGIGIFGGMDKIEVNGRQQESIRLIFRDQDVLYVSIHSLHRISKYKGKEGEQPKIYKL
ncbi:MAG: CarD family transcriptional regulator, partial [Bacteroidota bacterium]